MHSSPIDGSCRVKRGAASPPSASTQRAREKVQRREKLSCYVEHILVVTPPQPSEPASRAAIGKPAQRRLIGVGKRFQLELSNKNELQVQSKERSRPFSTRPPISLPPLPPRPYLLLPLPTASSPLPSLLLLSDLLALPLSAALSAAIHKVSEQRQYRHAGERVSERVSESPIELSG